MRYIPNWRNHVALLWRAAPVLLFTLLVIACSAEMPAQPASNATAAAPDETKTETGVVIGANNSTEITNYSVEIVNRYPHDPGAFTQGFIYTDGIFYEGTGLYGQSTLRKVDPISGEVLMGARWPDEVFGEGITLFDGKIYVLTWRENTGYIVDAETFELLDTFTYATEGWGLTHDGEQLIMSDGSSRLTFLDPATLTATGSVEVLDDGKPMTQLNELEYINGQIYANIWQTDAIVIIDPETGAVVGEIDLSGLLSTEELTQPVDVLNGIAYDSETDRLYVTGKLWPYVFEIDLVELE